MDALAGDLGSVRPDGGSTPLGRWIEALPKLVVAVRQAVWRAHEARTCREVRVFVDVEEIRSDGGARRYVLGWHVAPDAGGSLAERVDGIVFDVTGTAADVKTQLARFVSGMERTVPPE